METFVHLDRKNRLPLLAGWLMLCMAAFLFISIPGLAQEPTPSAISDDQVNAIAKEMYCPVCENIPLDVCPTQACAQWRELIREKLAAGWSEKQIKDYFVEQYGARVLAAPPAKGFYWAAYLVPPLAILAGLYILYRGLRSWNKPVQSSSSKPDFTLLTDEYIRRIEEELNQNR